MVDCQWTVLSNLDGCCGLIAFSPCGIGQRIDNAGGCLLDGGRSGDWLPVKLHASSGFASQGGFIKVAGIGRKTLENNSFWL